MNQDSPNVFVALAAICLPAVPEIKVLCSFVCGQYPYETFRLALLVELRARRIDKKLSNSLAPSRRIDIQGVQLTDTCVVVYRVQLERGVPACSRGFVLGTGRKVRAG